MTPEEKLELIQSDQYRFIEVKKEYWTSEEGRKIMEDSAKAYVPLPGNLPDVLKTDLGEHLARPRFHFGFADGDGLIIDAETASLKIKLVFDERAAKQILAVLVSKFVISEIMGKPDYCRVSI